MRYKLIAKVESTLLISENVSVKLQDMIVEFLKNSNGKLTNISVSKSVPTNKLNNFKQSFEKGAGKAKLKISIGGDKEFHNELVKELQTIESNLAFATNGLLQRVRWDNPEHEYIPENEMEEELISIRGFSANKRYPQPKANITSKALIGLVELSANYEPISLAKAFWREGMVYHTNFQYIQAFYQFYFVIEDFYISGKSSSKKSVMKKFQESKELLEIANNAVTQFQKLPAHKAKLNNFLAEYKCANTSIGILEMLYEVRNNLHHFHSKSTRAQGTPFNQSDFEIIAFTTMLISRMAISVREIKISQSLKNKKSD